MPVPPVAPDRSPGSELEPGETLHNTPFASDARALLDLLPGPVFRFDRTLRHTYANAAALRALGLPLDRVLGRTAAEVGIPEPVAGEIEDLMRGVLATGEPAEHRAHAATPAGEVVFLTRFVPEFGPRGAAIAVIGSAADITDQARAEAALRESEWRHRLMVESVEEYALVQLAPDGRVTSWNSGAERITGYTEAEALGLVYPDFFPPEARDRAAALLRTATADGRAEGEGWRVRKDGSRFWASVTLSAQYGRHGELMGFTKVTRDLTARRAAEEALRLSEARHRQMLADLTELVCRFRPDGTFTFVNDAYCRTFGKRADELIGRRWQPVAHPDDLAHIEAPLADMTQSNPVVVIENRVLTSDGVRWMEFVNRGFYDAAGALIEIQAVGRDVTDRRAAEDARRKLEADLRAKEERAKYERQLLHAQKLESLGVLAGGIAHDFNNLLTAILGYASLGRMRIAPSDPLAGDLKQIELASQRAADLCTQMLAYAGRGQFVVAPLDLSVLVQEMATLLSTALSKKAVLKFNLAEGLSPLVADPTQVRQVVMNLITNASDAIGPKSGVITLTTGEIDADERYLREIDAAPELPPGRYVYAEVSDTGCGMSEETKAKIFDPFFTTKFTGRGLGLAAVIGIVRAHKGAVKVYSQVGKGTTFKVLFPVAANGARPTNGSRIGPALAPFGRGRKALVVDDEEDVRVFARKVLEMAGFDVDVAADGRDGADAFAAAPNLYQLVVIDLTMPRLGGADAYREMRLARPDVRAILTSGFAVEEATSGFEGKGLAGFVRKPFRADELLKAALEAVGP